MNTSTPPRSALKQVASAALAAAMLLLAPRADALVITETNEQAGNPAGNIWEVFVEQSDVGNSFAIDWLVNSATTSGLDTDLAGAADFRITSMSDSVVELAIDITNFTTTAFQSAIVSFGFGVDPNASVAVVQAGDVFDLVGSGSGKQENFPGGFKKIDICVLADGCSGGSIKNGLQSGQSDSLILAIHADVAGAFANGVTLAAFPAKYQSSQGSWEPAGIASQGSVAPAAVPEPGTLLLLGSGTLLGAWRRRKAAA